MRIGPMIKGGRRPPRSTEESENQLDDSAGECFLDNVPTKVMNAQTTTTCHALQRATCGQRQPEQRS